MTAEMDRMVFEDLVYLISCIINGKDIDRDRAEAMDLSSLYGLAEKHLLTAITAMALESAGIRDEAFTQAKGKAVRKIAAMDIDRTAVLEKLEEAGIWYMPLKGVILKDLYPRFGMRQMSDNDILIDGTRMKDAESIMESLAFTCDHRSAAHTVYHKPPVSSFELHHKLFNGNQDRRIRKYYKDVKARLLKDEGKQWGYHFSDEDFYVYMISHEYKHYSGGGTGLRSLLDTYVYWRELGNDLDWTYIGEETEKLGIAGFEKLNRTLSVHLFTEEPLTDEEKHMLEYILSSGVYGTIQHHVTNTVDRFGGGTRGKLRYVLKRIFMSMDEVRAAYPLFAKVPVLLPFLPVYRFITGLRLRRERLTQEWKLLKGD